MTCPENQSGGIIRTGLMSGNGLCPGQRKILCIGAGIAEHDARKSIPPERIWKDLGLA